MSASNTITGNAGQMSLGGTTLSFTKWTATPKVAMADSTDSSTFDSAKGYTFGTSKPGVRSMDGTIEGNFDLDQTTTAVVQKLLDGDPVAAIFKFNAATTFASCDVLLEEVEVNLEVPEANMVTYSAKWRSQGTITLG